MCTPLPISIPFDVCAIYCTKLHWHGSSIRELLPFYFSSSGGTIPWLAFSLALRYSIVVTLMQATQFIASFTLSTSITQNRKWQSIEKKSNNSSRVHCSLNTARARKNSSDTSIDSAALLLLLSFQFNCGMCVHNRVLTAVDHYWLYRFCSHSQSRPSSSSTVNSFVFVCTWISLKLQLTFLPFDFVCGWVFFCFFLG